MTDLRREIDSLERRIKAGQPGVVALRVRLYHARHELLRMELDL